MAFINGNEILFAPTFDGYDDGVEAGKVQEWGEFWDVFQYSGTRTSYHSAFARGYWRSGTTYNPKYPITCKGNNTATSMFSTSTVKDTLVDITISGANTSVFYASSVVTIKKLILGENITVMGDWFNQCANLENIEVEGVIPVSVSFKSSPLSVESMQSIIRALKDYAGTEEDKVHTLTFSSACWAALDDTGASPDPLLDWKTYAMNKGWNV